MLGGVLPVGTGIGVGGVIRTAGFATAGAGATVLGLAGGRAGAAGRRLTDRAGAGERDFGEEVMKAALPILPSKD
jgi:hypothetical protein